MHHGGIEKDINLLIERSVGEALRDLGVKISSPNDLKSELEIPKERAHGDIATSVALRSSKLSGRSPIDLANLMKSRFEKEIVKSPLNGSIGKIEVKAPGFINIFLSSAYLCGILESIKSQVDSYGGSDIGKAAKLQIEFVSANPTGPLTIAHGRQAAIGDSLANILSFLGYDVTREYYLNDEGTQKHCHDRIRRNTHRKQRDHCSSDSRVIGGFRGSHPFNHSSSKSFWVLGQTFFQSV